MFSKKASRKEMGFDKEIEIDVGRWMRAILQKWWLIVTTTLVGVCITLVITLGIPSVYKAQAVICADASLNYEDAVEMLYYLQEYVVINERGIAERAVVLLGDNGITAEEIREMVDYDYEEGKIVMFIEVSHEDSQVALDVANAVAESFIIEAHSMLRSDSFKVLEKATLEEAGSPVIKFCIVGALLGFILPILIIVIMQIVSDKIYYVSDAELGGELELIGIIPDQTR